MRPQPSIAAPLGRLIALSLLMRLAVDTAARLFYPFLPEISRGLGISLSQGGLLISLRSAMVFVSPIFGLWNDRRGPRGLLTGALLLQAGSLWWLSSRQGLGEAILPMLLLGISAAAFIPTLQAAISELVPFQRRGRVLALVEFSWALTGVAILPLLGVAMVALGWQSPLRLVALVSLALAPLPWLLPWGQPLAAQARLNLRRTAGLVWRSPSARAAILVSGLMFVSAEVFYVTYGAWLERSFGMAPDAVGRVASLLGVAELSASALSSLIIDRVGKRRGVGAGLLAMTVTMAALPALGASAALAVVGLFAYTVSFEFTIVSNIGLLSEQVPPARGTVLALGTMAGGVARMASGFAGVVLFERLGMAAAAALAVAGSAVALWLVWRRVVERAPDGRPAPA
ncbi:MAG: MFS transporter [Caldilineales bacterium]|nr:MFS transporter [Caldilineales bacterium]MDW8318055.1 MFS transporter [Anaerolineae bacterium]